MSEVNMDDVEDVLKAAKEKKIELPQKNTVREFERWRKENTEATNVNGKAIQSYYELSKTALNAHAKLKKRVEQLEDIKDGLELDKELHQGTSTTIPLDEYVKKREQPDTQQEGFYRCHDCGHGPFAITGKVCDSCGGEAFDFIPDKPAQQEGHWECEECGDRPEMSPAIRITTHMRCKSCDNWPVRWYPSPTETPEECSACDGKGELVERDREGRPLALKITCSRCNGMGEESPETPEAEEPEHFDVREILNQAERIVRKHNWIGLANNIDRLAPELLRAWNRRAGTESTHYYERRQV